MSDTIWINRNKLTEYIINQEALPVLADGSVRLKVDSFSVTANNATYAVAGDNFGYWNFFPAGDGYGVVPMWGHATVNESKHDDVKVGERLYGYLPMGEHLDIVPDNISESGMIDAAAHRQPMSPIYNQYSRLAADPEHDPDKENERMLFAPLFKTGFLIADFFGREKWFGAENLIMTSASSKTSMGLASCAKNMSPNIKRIGLTSSGNVSFVEDTGLYDQTITYDDVASLPKGPSVCVDFAGNAGLLAQIHEISGDNLAYSCLVGATHVDARGDGSAGQMAGPQPILFFAPDHAVAAIKEKGPKLFGQQIAEQWSIFLNSVDGALTIDIRSGVGEAADVLTATLKGESDPATGIIIHP